MIELLGLPIQLFSDPSGRLYWPFLLSSLLFAFFISSTKEKKYFSRAYWLHPSSLLDIKLLLTNLLLKATLFPLILFSSFSVSVLFLKALRFAFPSSNGFEVSSLTKSILASLMAFVISDLLRFAQHILMHKNKQLRKLHKVHHSAKVLTPLTLFRAHPLEALLAGARNIITMGLTFGLYSFIFNGPVSGLDILGVNAFGFLFNGFLANLRHSPFPISFGPFEYIFISPRMHQVHHSIKAEHFNKNFGVALSLWDQLYGSFYRPLKVESESLVFGIAGDNGASYTDSLLLGLKLPQINIKEPYESLNPTDL